MKKQAILYVRQGSIYQVQKSNTQQLEQLQLLISYCNKQNIQIAFVFQESSLTENFDRRVWKELMLYVKANHQNIDYLLVTTWDRISRNATDALAVISELKKLQIEPIAIKQPLGFSTTQIELLRKIYLPFSEWNSETQSTENLNNNDE